MKLAPFIPLFCAIAVNLACEGSGEDPSPGGDDEGISTGGSGNGNGGASSESGGATDPAGGRPSGTGGSFTGSAGGAGGEAIASSGGDPSILECQVDEECVAVGNTAAPCYSAVCSLPTAASRAATAADPCLVEWTEIEGPAIPDGCGSSSDDTVPCPALCAQPPACIVPRCDAGQCTLITSSEPSGCVTGGGGAPASCEVLNSRREEALESARGCLPNGIIAECGDDTMVPNECGCPVAVNSNQSERVDAARTTYESWHDACGPPERCALVDCIQATPVSVCVSGSEAGAICRWQ